MSKEKATTKKAKETKKPVRTAELDNLLSTIRKNFGEASIFHGDFKAKEMEVIPSDSVSLNMALGVGGFPYGRMVEIFGMESSGKTTLTLGVIAEAQKAGKVCAFIDAEHALDTAYAKKLGINIRDLIIVQPDDAEQAMEITRALVESGQINVLVLDSVAALVPRAELEGEFDKANVGLHARLMSKAMRVLAGEANKNNVLMLFINQIRMKIGVMYGNPQTTTGGEALKFYSSIRLNVRKGEVVKDSEGRSVGGSTIVKVVKNKVAPPYTECEIPVVFGRGVDKAVDIYLVAKTMGIIEAKGAHNYLVSETEGEEPRKIGSSKDEAVKLLRSDKELAKEVIRRSMAENQRRLSEGDIEPSEEDADEIKAQEIKPEE